MVYTLKIQNEAIIELQEAFEWYEKKRLGLGEELIEEVEYCFTKITSKPQFYGFAGNSRKFRRIKTDRFPYIVVYEIEDSIVNVVAVRNTWMKPKY